jgi:hypothetical protein
MSQLRNEIQIDLERMESELGQENDSGAVVAQSFTWKGASVPCVPTSIRRGTTVDVGGNFYEIDCTLFVRRNCFLTADSTIITVDSNLYTVDSDLPTPVAGRTLIFRGATYRIVSARESGPRSHFELAIADAGSNR